MWVHTYYSFVGAIDGGDGDAHSNDISFSVDVRV